MQPLPMTFSPALSCERSAPTTPATSPALSKPLESWLIGEPIDEKAIATIAASDILRSEAAMALPALRQAALRPATQAEIMSIIGRRFATYPQPQRDEGEAAEFWADYFDALRESSPAAVEAGMAAHVADASSEFLPKPGRLAELAKNTANDGRWSRAHRRARAAVERSRDGERGPIRPENRQSAEEVAALMEAFHAKMAEKATVHTPKANALKPRPTPCARVDHTGMSAEMRQLLTERFGYQTANDATLIAEEDAA